MTEVRELDITTSDGRTVHAYDVRPGGDARLSVVWHGGSPNIGAPPAPLHDRAAELGVRWVGLDRAGYGGSTRQPGRRVASATDDVSTVLDALDVTGPVAAAGHSGGGPHALACAALLPGQVVAAVTIASPAPGVGGDDADPFTTEDEQALGGRWAWMLDVVRSAIASGPEPLQDDEAAMRGNWGFDLAAITAPVLVLHGRRDQLVPPSAAEALAAALSTSELRMTDDGHITVLDHLGDALDWLLART